MTVVRLRPTRAEDVAFVLTCENDPGARAFVGQWTADQHRAALGDHDCHHVIVELEDRAEPVGYAMLWGLASPHGSIELRRLVTLLRDRGIGRRVLWELQHHVFTEVGAHRLWLDVRSRNDRARHLYRSEGFTEEGTLRDCLRDPDGYESLVVMSKLDSEYIDNR